MVAKYIRTNGYELVLILAVGTFFAAFTLAQPYHLDTVLYLNAIAEFLDSGEMGRPFASRFFNSWLYLPSVAAFGTRGVWLSNIVFAVALVVMYMAVVRRMLGDTVAVASALLLATAPATIITITHLKEDINALMLVAAALAIMGQHPTPRRLLAAGATWAVALCCKEFPVALLPFFVLHIYLMRASPRGYRDLLAPQGYRSAAPAIGWFLLGGAATLAILSPDHFQALMAMGDSWDTGQFLGPFSELQPLGWRMWKEGVLHLHPLEALAGIGLTVGLMRRRFELVLWSCTALVLFMIFSNSSVMRARIFSPVLFFLLPVMVEGARLLIAGAIRAAGGTAEEGDIRVRRVLLAAVLALSMWQVNSMLPTLEYRNAYHPQREFFGGMRSEIAASSLLIGMNSCALASHYSGLDCRSHPVNATKLQAVDYVSSIIREARQREVYLLPDFFAYDQQGHLSREFRMRFSLTPAFGTLAEDYHALTYSRPTEETIDRFLARGCSFTTRDSEALQLSTGLMVENVTLHFSCKKAGKRKVALIEYRGHRTFLKRMEILRAQPRRAIAAPMGRGQ